MKGWRADTVDCKPVEYEAETFGWPNRTTAGELQYENTHFKTQAEAWDRLLSETDGAVSFSGRNVIDHEHRLGIAKDRAATAAKRFALVRDQFAAWEREAGKGL